MSITLIRQMQQLEEDYKAERIARAEYEERKNRLWLDRSLISISSPDIRPVFHQD